MRLSNVDARDAFFDELFKVAQKDPQVIFLTADMGAFSLERFKKELPGQYINVGVAEQNMVSVAAGLALGGKKVFIYSIVPFATLRCYEQIKIDLCCMNLPVVIIGIGAGVMYGADGPTHHALHDIAVMRALPEMTIFNPTDATITQAVAQMAYQHNGPVYVRLEKGNLPILYDEGTYDFSAGLAEVTAGQDVTIIATGLMVHKSIEAAFLLKQQGISAGVVDLFRVKPLNFEKLSALVQGAKRLVTVEEHSVVGGLGSSVSEFLTDSESSVPLKRLGVRDCHCYQIGSREEIHEAYNLDAVGIARSVEAWMRG